MSKPIKRGRVNFRATEALEAALVAAAEYAGVRPAEYARRIVVAHLEAQRPAGQV